MNPWTRRQFACNVVAAGATLSSASSVLLAASSSLPGTPVAPLSLVDPELRSALEGWPQLVLSPASLATARKVPLLPPLPPPMPQPAERQIPGPAGAPDVHITLIDPNPGQKNRPVLVHTHGGGMVLPNSALYPLIQTIAHNCRCVVVSVDYRMAPETKFVGSIADNYAALKWVYANADTLGIDRSRIAVGGESAGGGHAALLAIRARDLGEIPICFQLLIYPMLDDRTGSSRPEPPTAGKFIWNAQCNRFGWTAFLGQPAGSATVPPNSVPARVANLDSLPPAWIGAGSIDLFVDEDVEYARRLIDAGVSTQLDVFPGGYHAFDLLVSHAAVSQRFCESWTSALRRAFATA